MWLILAFYALTKLHKYKLRVVSQVINEIVYIKLVRILSLKSLFLPGKGSEVQYFII